MKFVLGIVAVLVTVVNCLPQDDFFPYGEGTVDKKLNRRSKTPLSITFREPFTFLGDEQSVLYVFRDGYVSFSEGTRGTKIAPFNTRLKIPRGRAFVWYRTVVSSAEEEKIVRLIRNNFRSRGSLDVSTFTPTSFVIVTWDSLAVRNRQHEIIAQQMTFQLVLAADATHSFAFFLYADENDYPAPDSIGHYIDVGFTSGKDLSQWEFEMVYTSEANKAAALFEAMRDSNIGSNGVWAYQIDGRMDGNIISAAQYMETVEVERPLADAPAHADIPQAQEPLNTGNTFDVEVTAFEDQCSTRTCSTNGQCVPYPTGYCCACSENYMGNGIHCWPSQDNKRMNGRVNGTINGYTIGDNVFLHTFITPTGGRSYTAISPVPESIAYTMQLLLPIGELMGWLVAEPSLKGINGFKQTGGELQHTVTMSFQTGEQVTITQQFPGLDAESASENGLTTIQGTVPNLPRGAEVALGFHSEVYTKYQPGYVFSSEQRTLTADGRELDFTVEQTITFQECEADDINTDASLTAMRVNTTFAYSIYEVEGQILRYAMVTSVGPDAGLIPDPCQSNNCDVNAQCLSRGTDFDCQCNSGFTGNGYTCVEQPRDPCENNNCDPNAYCSPAGSSFTCQCAPGFNGDGRTCTRNDPCANNDCSDYAYCNPEPTSNTFYCQCATGYVGDGYTCTPEGQTDPCASNECDPNARCYPYDQQSYYCRCNLGYSGDGYTCTQDPPSDPCLNNRCDANAQCSPVANGYTCNCNPGYQGDGYTCELPDQLVSSCTDCSVDADCLPEGRGFRCLCRAGFQGTGLQCEDIDECVAGAEIACDPNAQCFNSRGSYTCYCRPGYRGDGFTCDALPEVQGSLVFGQGMSVMHLPLDPAQSGSKVFMKRRQTVVGVGYDCRDEHVYWTDVSRKTIMRANVDGTGVQTLVNTSLSSPEGIAIDFLSRNMYWTDSGFDRIEVASLDGRNRHVLFDQDLANPRSIALDPVGGYLYWADWDRDGPRIERSAMDGSDREVLVDSNLVMPNGLTIDLVSQLLCWADAGTQKIECMNLNGDPRTRYTVFTTAQYPFGLASLGSNLYWTDWRTSNIQSINKNGGTEAQSHALPRGGNGKIYGIAAVSTCPDGNNRCASQNGGCQNLCLPAPNAVGTCTCPNALSDNEVPCN